MAGLLDFEDPNTAGAMQLGLGLLNAGGPSRMPVSLGQGIAQGGTMAMDAMRQARQDLLKKKLAQLEIEKGQLTIDQVKKELAKDEELKAAFKSSYQSPEQQALAAGGQGPTNAAAATIHNFAPKLDQKGLMGKLMGIDPVTALKFKEYLEPKMTVVGENQRALMPDATAPTGFRTVLDAAPKKTKLDEALDAAGITDPIQRAAFARKALEKDTTHAPAASTMVKLPEQEKAFESELGKKQASALIEGRAAADDAKQMLETNKVGRQILNKGMVTGFGANAIVGIGQALKAAGIDFGGDATSNSQAYTANMAQNVGKLIKQFGAGTGLSDADREYATKMAGGLITVDEKAIRKILDINDKAALNVIRLHNKRAMGVKTNIPLVVEESSDGWSVVK